MTCLETDVEGGVIPSLLPQLEQKLADDGTDALQTGQTLPGKLEIPGMRFSVMVILSILSTPQDMVPGFFIGIPANIRMG